MYTLENKRISSCMTSVSATPDSTRSVPKSPPEHVQLLADDLTGACDAAVAFLGKGRGVRVWLHDRAIFEAPETVQAVVTASRHLEPEQAAKAVLRASAALRKNHGTLLFKKIDSTLRGPLAAELLAAQQAMRCRAILLAPAFPSNGRTVQDGILRVQDASESIQRISIFACFPDHLHQQMTLIARAEEIAAALHSGKTILVCDSTTQRDLEALASAALQVEGMLYAGSSGLARALAAVSALPTDSEELPVAPRTLVISGTAHPVTELQLRQIDLGPLPGTTLLRVRCEPGDQEQIRAACSARDPQALVLTGGETALFVLRALGADSLLLRGEFAPGIPWAVAQGGLASGRIVVTKSGGFGAAFTLNHLLHRLSGQA